MLKTRTGFIVIYYLKHEPCTVSRETVIKITKKRSRAARGERKITTMGLAAERAFVHQSCVKFVRTPERPRASGAQTSARGKEEKYKQGYRRVCKPGGERAQRDGTANEFYNAPQTIASKRFFVNVISHLTPRLRPLIFLAAFLPETTVKLTFTNASTFSSAFPTPLHRRSLEFQSDVVGASSYPKRACSLISRFPLNIIKSPVKI